MLAILHPRRSEYGKLHRSEYEYAHFRAFGGMSKMQEYIPVTDKSNPLTTVLKDNLVLVYVEEAV